MDASARPYESTRRLALGVAALLVVTGSLGCDPVRSTAARGPLEARPQGPPIYLLLKLDERRLYVMQDDDGSPRQLESYPVAIGSKEWETPTGRFRVKAMKVNPHFVTFDWKDPSKVTGMIPPGPDNPLGQRWIGFASAYGWDIGFHGTPKPELLGQAVSHGCVRMHNRDVVALYDLVRIGTPVIVQP